MFESSQDSQPRGFSTSVEQPGPQNPANQRRDDIFTSGFSFDDDSLEEYRNRLFSQVLLNLALNITALIIAFYTLIPTLGVTSSRGSFLLFGVLALVVGTRVLFNAFGRRGLCVTLMLGSLSAVLVGSSFYLGGVMSPTMIFLLALPVLASTLLPVRWALFWTGVTVLSWLLLVVAEWRGAEIVQLTYAANIGIVQVLSLMGTLLVMMGVLTSYLSANTRLRSSMEVKTRRLDYLASHDTLTNVPNRRCFFEEAQRCLNRTARLGQAFALLVIDLNDFKAINDQHGHAMGDAVLKNIAHRMQFGFRKTDFVARIGGDEFGVLLESAENKAGVTAAVKRFLATTSETLISDGKKLEYACSIGAALHPGKMDNLSDLYEAADTAMYASKRSGEVLSFG